MAKNETGKGKAVPSEAPKDRRDYSRKDESRNGATTQKEQGSVTTTGSGGPRKTPDNSKS